LVIVLFFVFIDPLCAAALAFFLIPLRGFFVSMHGRVIAAQGLFIFFIFIDPYAGRQPLSLPLAKESGWGGVGTRT
jgi:hypothetical protein